MIAGEKKKAEGNSGGKKLEENNMDCMELWVEGHACCNIKKRGYERGSKPKLKDNVKIRSIPCLFV